jgi:hypothetical protein
MNVHLVVFSVPEHKMTLVEHFQVPKEDKNNQKLKLDLIQDFQLVVPNDFKNCENVTDERLGAKHELFILSEDSINHQEPNPNDIVLPDIKRH